MTMRLVECIPNFSEGRRPEVIESIERAIRKVPGVHILDRHSDADHNRSVVTFVGPPDSAAKAAFAAIARAAELIDLDQHQGEHPRIGATDVVPFVPLAGTTMEECVELARRLGRRVGTELQIPVYLYEQAATRPDRVNLENLRRGEYEALKDAIATDPDRAPDFGPARLGKAGATVIGARSTLIAFNVYLGTDDVEVARKIARAVRHSSGGLRYVKALGLLVEGRAQVSMNLTDYTRTPVARVVESIRREAARHGTWIHHTELIGLIPQAALVDAAQWYLQLDQFEPDQILETRLYAALAEEEPSLLERLAAPTPTPGGGSAAAFAAAMAAGLVSMVAGLTASKVRFRSVHDRMRAILREADSLRQELDGAVVEDADAYGQIVQARRMPKGTQEESQAREQAIQRAMQRAAEVPLQVASEALRVMELATECAEIANPNAITDAATAAALAQAALRGAALNVAINAQALDDPEKAQGWLARLGSLEATARDLEARLEAALQERAGLGPVAP